MAALSDGSDGPLCGNLSQELLDYPTKMAANWTNKRANDSLDYLEIDYEEQRDALLYIVVVLFFYSFGIVFMMVKYMRREHRELEESKLYQRYIKAAREHSTTNRGRLTNRLALQALNTVNAIPQTTQVSGKVTFV